MLKDWAGSAVWVPDGPARMSVLAEWPVDGERLELDGQMLEDWTSSASLHCYQSNSLTMKDSS
jgi:hypothetical protein